MNIDPGSAYWQVHALDPLIPLVAVSPGRIIHPALTKWHYNVAEWVARTGRPVVMLPYPEERGIALPGLEWPGPLH